MKKEIVLFIGVGLLSLNVLGDQSVGDKTGVITCVAKSGNFTVKLSASKKVLTIIKPGEKSEVYKVSETVGDTATWYAPESGAPMLSFDDEGDYLQFNASQNGVDIICD